MYSLALRMRVSITIGLTASSSSKDAARGTESANGEMQLKLLNMLVNTDVVVVTLRLEMSLCGLCPLNHS